MIGCEGPSPAAPSLLGAYWRPPPGGAGGPGSWRGRRQGLPLARRAIDSELARTRGVRLFN